MGRIGLEVLRSRIAWRDVAFLVLLLQVLLAPALAGRSFAQDAHDHPIPVYLFWREGCPHCANARVSLEAIATADGAVELRLVEVGRDAALNRLFAEAIAAFGLRQAAVPLVAIGRQAIVGYSPVQTDAIYRTAIADCRAGPCDDVVGRLMAGLGVTEPVRAPPPGSTALPVTLDLPIIGKVAVRDLSLPALTVLLAAVDGFNPCAMWVLILLIGLLLGLKDERRMWMLGIAFLVATAAVYFAVLTAWLNIVLFLGAVIWVRLAIGALSLAVGTYFLREYWLHPDPTCRVTRPGQRRHILEGFKAVVSQNSVMLSVLGIIVLAGAVNLIELLCSAGVPAVYTQILALNELPVAAYYAYLALYVLVFLIDDAAIFATAMIALKVTGLTGAYTRYSHLIGGAVLLIIGALLILRPDLLSFGATH